MKSTKHSLLMSAIALLLCFSMLIGTTFAWFTDSVTSSNNIIKSGTLDVEMYWADGTEAPASATWKDASEGPIFTYDKWEPGYVDVKHVKIANEGSLALKYQLNIVANGEVSKLADVIDVYFVDPAVQVKDRADLDKVTPEGTLADVLAGMPTNASGTLLAEDGKDEVIVTIALKMREEANNDYQDKSIGSDFSVQLLATQLTSENDSFDDQYDGGLESAENGISRTLEDGSTVFYYNEESGYYGRVRLMALPENLGSEYVVPAEVNDLGGALVGATLDKLTIPAGVASAYKSLEGATIGEIVLAEGMTTIPNRLFYKTNVESVVIPSSVTIIEENAFAQTAGVEELVIPASVTTVEEAAFQHMTNLKTVTFEGNTAIQGYAFRGCTELRTVNLKGDDVTFIPSTLNGRNSCWFCNGESNNPNTSDITFYVVNETVASRVKTAMGAEADNTDIIVLSPVTGSDIKDQLTDSTATYILAGEDIDLSNTEFAPSSNMTLTIKDGKTFDLNDNSVIRPASGSGSGLAIPTNATVTVKNGEVVNGGDMTAVDISAGATATFENVDFVGNGDDMIRLRANAGTKTTIVFSDCSFTNAGVILSGMNGACEIDVQFIGCTFEGSYKMYDDEGNVLTDPYGHIHYTSEMIDANSNYIYGDISFENCTFDFDASESTYDRTVISLKGPTTSYGVTTTLTLKNVTVTGKNVTPIELGTYKANVTVVEEGTNTYTIDGSAVNYDGTTK